ncbi:MAG: hypothetical protein ABI972_11605 [Acidobacteriota bacterium]
MVSFSNSGYQPPELQRTGQTLIFTIRARRHPFMLVFAVIWLSVCTSVLFTTLSSAMRLFAVIPLFMIGVFALVFIPLLLGREVIELTPSVVRFQFTAGPYRRQREMPVSLLQRVREMARPGASWHAISYSRQQAQVPAPSLAFEFEGEVIRCADGLSPEDAPEVLQVIQGWLAERRR